MIETSVLTPRLTTSNTVSGAAQPSGGPELARDLTTILQAISSGDRQAYDQLLPRVYDELRGIASQRMAGEREGHTLSATALVHETYLKLLGNEKIEWRDRSHFYAAAAESMRRILIDLARKKRSPKHGGDRQRIPLAHLNLEFPATSDALLVLDGALSRLRDFDERMHSIVLLRFFSGLSLQETADALGVGLRTVKRDWTCARAWLYREIRRSQS